MPNMDGTGPLGKGEMTGRQMGKCNGEENTNNGRFRTGCGCCGGRKGRGRRGGCGGGRNWNRQQPDMAQS